MHSRSGDVDVALATCTIHNLMQRGVDMNV